MSENGGMLTEAIIPADVPYRWMTHVEGSCHAELCRFAVENGGHVRRGIGDNPRFDGALSSNSDQVSRVAQMARKIERRETTPTGTRALLDSAPENQCEDSA